MAESTASQIIDAIGGPGNIKSLTHCATRLRFELVDAGKVDKDRLDHMKGVLGAVPQSGNRYQVVIGGGVASMYDKIMQLPQMANVGTVDGGEVNNDGSKKLSNAEVKAQERSKVKGKHAWVDNFFEFLSDTFRPIINVLLGASLIIAILNVLIACHVITNDTESPTLLLCKAAYEGVFYFLPIMIAYNGAKKLKVDGWVGATIMAALMTPQFMALSDPAKWSGIFGDKKGLAAAKGALSCVTNSTLGTQSCTTKVFGLPLQLNDYSGSVFVPLFMVAVLALVYKALERIIPDSVQMVFVPFLSMVIMIPITAFLLGPLGVWVGNGLGIGLAWLNNNAPFIFAILIPMLYPFLVPLGLHWPLNALMLVNINTLGYDFIQGPMGVWNFACFGATAGVLVIAMREKNVDMRQTAFGALMAGLLGGVSEPSLYGIHLRYKLVYKRMLIGCFAGGVVIAILGWIFPSTLANGQVVHGVTTTAFAFTSLLTIPVFSQMWVYAIAIAVAFFLSMFLIITLDYRTPEQKAADHALEAEQAMDAVEAPSAPAAADGAATATATATATKTDTVAAPVSGHVISLDEAGDPVFASRALGEGVGIQPADSVVVAPVSGVLSTVAETGHAFGIKTDDDVEILVHVGIDTVKMNGEGFTTAVTTGQRVNAGDKLVTVDFDKVKAAGFNTVTLMTVLNTAALGGVTPKTGIDVKAGDTVLEISH
ncbi:glucose PTS transporter subunit IIA [Bifidobacterium boum]|uniref:Phosphotransferase system, EIIB/C n=1 Tax=Bifidobacterium boum TaxID=78343 RepID=A0A086ZIL9_9BIFI|nr:glucose PTS transporter subunit IIA [Bifidobacterium boum]KFI46369.1 phosphotransferase system, EIIB/C [Bifidobacterium boum]MCF2561470.1 PTS glucose transporter subunit IIA [Bifidobacterium boum]